MNRNVQSSMTVGINYPDMGSTSYQNRNWEGRPVPDVLLTGHHLNIARWRRQQSLLRTRRHRPDMLEKAELTPEDRAFLQQTPDE